jgi:hypothetical protein
VNRSQRDRLPPEGLTLEARESPRQHTATAVFSALGATVGSFVAVFTLALTLGDRLYVTTATGDRFSHRITVVETRLGIPSPSASSTCLDCPYRTASNDPNPGRRP